MVITPSAEILRRHLFCGTEDTRTGAKFAAEVETHFRQARNGQPITVQQSLQILSHADEFLPEATLTIDLGRQCLELSIEPCFTPEALLERTHRLLQKLYRIAARYGAVPVFAPIMTGGRNLLHVANDRDRLFHQIDGPDALNILARTASVQFNIDVNPTDAIPFINLLFGAGIHRLQDETRPLWLTYLQVAHFDYAPNRYGGPEHFNGPLHYAKELARHNVIMHDDHVVDLPVADVPGLDVELFIRSVWWFFRLRRYKDTLVLEIRPMARHADADINDCFAQVLTALGLSF